MPDHCKQMKLPDTLPQDLLAGKFALNKMTSVASKDPCIVILTCGRMVATVGLCLWKGIAQCYCYCQAAGSCIKLQFYKIDSIYNQKQSS